MNDLVDFLAKIRRINSIMVQASTSKYTMMEQLETEYQKLRKDLSAYFDLSHASDPNGFMSLQEFFGYCRASLPHWEQRRAFVREMYADIERSLEAAIRNNGKIGTWTIPEVSAAPKILFLAANPKGLVSLRLDEEVREIEDRIMRAQKKDRIVLVNKGAVRISDLQFYLNQEQPSVVHFSGHGSEEGEVILEDTLGNARAVPPEALTRLFKNLKDRVNIVVLNACFSLEQAHAISQHIGCVVGMSSSISDEASITFASAFYLALAMEKSVREAFDQGITELALWRIQDEDKPQLIIREGTDPSVVFLLQPKSTEAKAEAQATIKQEHGELVDCGYCKGTGQVHSPTSIFGEKCPVCGGVGKKRI